MGKLFPELDLRYVKSEVTYKLTKQNPTSKKDVTIFVTVHLDNEMRTVTMRGLNKTFEFTKSDIWLTKTINELITEGLELADKEQRVISPGLEEDKK